MIKRISLTESITLATALLHRTQDNERTKVLNYLEQMENARDNGVTTLIVTKAFFENGKAFFGYPGLPGAYYTLTDGTLLVLTDKRTHEGVPTGKQLLMEWAVVFADTGRYAGDKAIVTYDNAKFRTGQLGERVTAKRAQKEANPVVNPTIIQ